MFFSHYNLWLILMLEKSAVEFQPKPKPQSDKQKHPTVAASQLPHDLEPLSEDEHKQSNGSVHAVEHNAIEHNTISDVLHMRDEELSFDCSENRPDTLVSKDTHLAFLEKPLQQAVSLRLSKNHFRLSMMIDFYYEFFIIVIVGVKALTFAWHCFHCDSYIIYIC